MITMYKDGRRMAVNPTPKGIAALEKYGWSTEKPKEEKKEKPKDAE